MGPSISFGVGDYTGGEAVRVMGYFCFFWAGLGVGLGPRDGQGWAGRDRQGWTELNG